MSSVALADGSTGTGGAPAPGEQPQVPAIPKPMEGFPNVVTDHGPPGSIFGFALAIRYPWAYVGLGVMTSLRFDKVNVAGEYVLGLGARHGENLSGSVGSLFGGYELVSGLGATTGMWGVERTRRYEPSFYTQTARYDNEVITTKTFTIAVPTHWSLVVEGGAISGHIPYQAYVQDVGLFSGAKDLSPRVTTFAAGLRYQSFHDVDVLVRDAATGEIYEEENLRNGTVVTAHLLVGALGVPTKFDDPQLFVDPENRPQTSTLGFDVNVSAALLLNAIATLDLGFGKLPSGGWYFSAGNTYTFW